MKTRQFHLLSGMFLAGVFSSVAQPTITIQPQAQAVAPGKDVKFTVGARSSGPVAYQWQRKQGTTFSDLAGRTNSSLVLTNAQFWNAASYRAIVTDSTGSKTSGTVHLYVLSLGVPTNRVVLDNFDDNKLTGWGTAFAGTMLETNQQFTLRGYWQKKTVDMTDTLMAGYSPMNLSLQSGQTAEWRVDLIGMNDHTDSANIELVNSAGNGGYAFFKGRDFIHICKPSWLSGSMNHAHCDHKIVVTPSTNVILAFAATYASPDLILTTRVLDKTNPDTVLYQGSFVDTPNVDRTLTQAEFEAISGIQLNTGADIPGSPWTSFSVAGLHAWQYNYDGKQPGVEATFDNFELWTYEFNPPTSLRFTSSHYDSGHVLLNWSNEAKGMKLQRSASLRQPNWQDVPGSETVNAMNLPVVQATEFFRLIEP